MKMKILEYDKAREISKEHTIHVSMFRDGRETVCGRRNHKYFISSFTFFRWRRLKKIYMVRMCKQCFREMVGDDVYFKKDRIEFVKIDPEYKIKTIEKEVKKNE